MGGRRLTLQAGYRDNTALEQRDDVLTFTGAVLTEPLEVIGIPEVEIAHTSDNPHADLFVRLCEVDAKGRSRNVSDVFSRLDPADRSGVVRLSLDAIAHSFAAGSRIRVQVSGGAHPQYARNLGTDEDQTTSTRLVPSHRTVAHGRGGTSHVVLPVVP